MSVGAERCLVSDFTSDLLQIVEITMVLSIGLSPSSSSMSRGLSGHELPVVVLLSFMDNVGIVIPDVVAFVLRGSPVLSPSSSP